MEEPSNFSSSLSPADSKKWIVRIVLALVLGQAIWALVVALTAHLLVPLIARVMGGDPASPLYLGKGDIDVPGLFVAILEFCLAGIVAAILNSWVQKPPKTVRRKVAVASSLSLQAPIAAPVAPPAPRPAPVVTPPVQAAPPKPAVAPVAPAVSVAAKPAAPAAPSKPEKAKEVYYNIVGEPITMDDE
jgi:large-conductance mechanosensitive channel